MDQSPLVTEQINAGARFLAEFGKYVPVQVAFWLRESDEPYWKLHVVSDKITDDNFDVAYGEVLRIHVAMGDPYFDPFEVKLIGSNERLAKAAMDLQKQYSGHIPARLLGKAIGGVAVDELYVYPAPALVHS